MSTYQHQHPLPPLQQNPIASYADTFPVLFPSSSLNPKPTPFNPNSVLNVPNPPPQPCAPPQPTLRPT